MHHFVNFSLVVLALTLFCSNFGGITARRAAVARDDSDALAHEAPSAAEAAAEIPAKSVRGKDEPKNKESDAGSNPKDEDETLPDPHDKYDKVDRDKIDPVHAPRPEEPTKKPANHKMVSRETKTAHPPKSEALYADDSAAHEAYEPAKELHADIAAAHKTHETVKELHANNATAPHRAHEAAGKLPADSSAAPEPHEPVGKLHPNSAGQPEKSADGVGQLNLAGKSDKEDEVGKISPHGGVEETDKTIKAKSVDIIERKDAILSEALHKDVSHNVTSLVNLENIEVPKNKRPMLPVKKLDGDSESTTVAPSDRSTEAPSNGTGGVTTQEPNTGNGQINNSRDAASTLLVTILSYVLASGSVLCYLDNFGLHT